VSTWSGLREPDRKLPVGSQSKSEHIPRDRGLRCFARPKGLEHCAAFPSLDGCVPNGPLYVVQEVGDVAGTVAGGWLALGAVEHVPPEVQVVVKLQSPWGLAITSCQKSD
jgi:hypothetical protein